LIVPHERPTRASIPTQGRQVINIRDETYPGWNPIMPPRGIAPYFLVADVVQAAEYYRDRLGFTIRGYFFEDPPVFAMVGRGDDQTIMLSLVAGGRGGSNRTYKPEGIDVYLWVDDVDALYAAFQRAGADIVAPPQVRVYGMKELEVRDLDGYVLCFGEDVPSRSSG
jgi:uncharacterized glyoxalase superfamily protein PhnB